MPAKRAPTASSASGMVMTFGDSCTWLITSAEARGVPWNVMKMRRQE